MNDTPGKKALKSSPISDGHLLNDWGGAQAAPENLSQEQADRDADKFLASLKEELSRRRTVSAFLSQLRTAE
jgi:hypothetical protein